MSLTLAAIVIALAYPVAVLWERMWTKHEATAKKRARCMHEWGELRCLSGKVGFMHFPDAFYKHCVKCGEQMNCYSDGSEYIPGKQYKDD